MSGGAPEYVMGLLKDSTGAALIYSYTLDNDTYSSGFTASTLPFGSKYVDHYSYGTTITDQTAYNRRILGDATGETRGWYSDITEMIENTSFMFSRGRNGVTICSYNAFRVAIKVNN